MHVKWKWAVAWPLLAALALGAAAAGIGGCDSDTCAALQGRNFTTVEDAPCGLTPSGSPAFCAWSIDFRNGRYSWTFEGDQAEAGSYSCDGDSVSAHSDDGATSRSGSYEADGEVLTWEGRAYTVTASE